jgi:hypothetical protein
MYHSIRVVVNLSNVSQNNQPLQHRTIRCSTCDEDFHSVELTHRMRLDIRASTKDVHLTCDLNLWLSMRQESSNLVSDIPVPNHSNEIQNNCLSHKSMRWPCSHYCGSRMCNSYVDILGAICQDCKVSTCAYRHSCEQPSSMRRY